MIKEKIHRKIVDGIYSRSYKIERKNYRKPQLITKSKYHLWTLLPRWKPWKPMSFFRGALTVLISILVVFTVVQAGSLTPSASPSATSYTLENIYNRLSTNATATAGNHNLSTTTSPTASFYTLTEIYDAIPTIDATKIFTGTSYLGISGTLTLGCSISLFDGTDNLVADGYDGDGNGANRWCITDDDDIAADDVIINKIAWIGAATTTGTWDNTNLASSTVKSGVTFATSTTGAYPSSDWPLPSADSGVTDLAGNAAGNITSSNGAVEWWQSDGTYATSTLDFPTLSNVCDTDTSNNSTGTLSVTAGSIATSTTYCGVAGTLLGNLWNGSLTAGGFDGGSQANGGVDDYNNGGSETFK